MSIDNTLINNIKEYILSRYQSKSTIVRSVSIHNKLFKTKAISNKICYCIERPRLADPDISFQKALFKIIDELDYKDSDVYKRSFVSKQTFSKIRSSEEYHPDRDTAIKLCFGLRLSLKAANDLLKKAGYTLSRSSRRDLVFEYFFINSEYDLMLINESLYELNQEILKV